MAKRRRLSSRLTFLTKFGWSWIHVALFLGPGLFLLSGGRVDLDGVWPREMGWLFLAFTPVVGAYQYWAFVPVKQVELSENALFISNFVQECVVPLTDVSEVRQRKWLEPRAIRLSFRRETDFGERIVFLPRGRQPWFWRDHPVVLELREAVERARQPPSS